MHTRVNPKDSIDLLGLVRFTKIKFSEHIFQEVKPIEAPGQYVANKTRCRPYRDSL